MEFWGHERLMTAPGLWSVHKDMYLNGVSLGGKTCFPREAGSEDTGFSFEPPKLCTLLTKRKSQSDKSKQW